MTNKRCASSPTPKKRPKRQQKATQAKSTESKPPPSKAATVLGLLKRKTGATLAELVAATAWQPHSVRGFLSGTVRKRMALVLLSEASADGRRYRIEQSDPHPASS
jgi:hypothetical protein